MKIRIQVAACALVCALVGLYSAFDVAGGEDAASYWRAVSLAYRRAVLSSKLDENVEEVLVQEGQPVKKGDVLVRFDSRLLKARIAIAETEADFEARIKSAQKRYEFLQGEFQRLQRIQGSDESGRFVSEVELAKARYQMETALLELQELDRLRKLKEAELQYYRAQQGDYLIRSPIDGVVAQVWVRPGEMAGKGQRIVEVIDPDVIEVRVHLPEQYAPVVLCGQKALVRFPALSPREFEGKVHVVSPQVDSSSGTFLVKVLVEPDVEEIRPGMGCEVTFPQSPHP